MIFSYLVISVSLLTLGIGVIRDHFVSLEAEIAVSVRSSAYFRNMISGYRLLLLKSSMHSFPTSSSQA